MREMKLRIPLTWLLLLIVGVLFLAACSGGTSGSPAGWEKFEGDGFEIYLPETFEGGSDPAQVAAAAEMLRQNGNEEMAVLAEANASSYKLYLVDTEVTPGSQVPAVMNVIKTQDPFLSSVAVSTIAEATISQAESLGITVTTSEEFTAPGYEAWFLVEEVDMIAGVEGTINVVQYIFKSDDTMWVLTYGCDSDELAERMAEFEQSALTFKEK
jgi:hypothetical protein